MDEHPELCEAVKVQKNRLNMLLVFSRVLIVEKTASFLTNCQDSAS